MVAAAYVPDAGHIIKIDLDPKKGHEQAGWRPALILSPKIYNEKTRLAVVVSITNQAKGYPFEVPLPGNIKTTGVVLADAVKSVDWHARQAKGVCRALSQTRRRLSRGMKRISHVSKTAKRGAPGSVGRPVFLEIVEEGRPGEWEAVLLKSAFSRQNSQYRCSV